MWDTINKFLQSVDDFVWGPPLMVLILAGGIYLTVRMGILQIRKLPLALKWMVKNEESGEGEVTSFGALCTALSATIGTGNIVGVATAIGTGGPGALFWMEIAAFFGICVGLFGIGTFSQVNGISSAVNSFFDPNMNWTITIPGIGERSWTVVIASLILSICVALVLIGGIKRIANVSQIVVPFMAVIYIVICVALLICNFREIPDAIVTIVRGAFNPSAVTGGIVGSMMIAIQKGVARGIFSNEAGLGSAPIAAAAAKTKEPVRQGLISMTGTFIDTIVICTMTGLSIVLTGAWQVEGLEGVGVTTYAFKQGLPIPEELSAFLLMLCLVFFAFTTILGWDYYSERCLEYLSGGKEKSILVYRWLYIIAVFIGPYMTVKAVWTIADIFNGLMAIPNMIAIFALSGVVAKETKSFFERYKNEKSNELK